MLRTLLDPATAPITRPPWAPERYREKLAAPPTAFCVFDPHNATYVKIRRTPANLPHSPGTRNYNRW